MKKLLLLLFFSFFNLSAFAQEFIDLAKFYYTFSPNNGFDSTDQKTNIIDYGAEFLIPIPLKNGNAIITGLAIEQLNLRPDPSIVNPISLYNVNPRIGMNIVHNKRWTGQYILLPQIASDLKGDGLKGHDMQLGMLAVLSLKKSADFQYRIGLYYNSALYGPGGFLIAGLYYQNKKKNFSIDMALPIWADINYKLNSNLSGGLRLDAMIRSYYLNQPYFGTTDEYITRLTPDLYAYVQYNIAKNYVFQFKVGHSVLRGYRMFEVDDKVDLSFSGINFGDDRTQLNTNVKDGFMFQVRFHYRFYL